MDLEPTSLTQIEVLGLQSRYNFADGHAYHDLAPSQAAIIDRLDRIWAKSAALSIHDAGTLYFEAFWKLAQSNSLRDYAHFRICPTASNAIDIAGAWLVERKMTAALLHPTFDNLCLLLKRRGIDPEPIDETRLYEGGMDYLRRIQSDAIFLVNPNNPTGRNLSAEQFRSVVTWCAKTAKTLILDNTFRFFVAPNYDHYEMLIDSGVSFISIEDTGKVWPTQDMKASLLVYSADVARELEIIYEEIYLCVSNFTLGILTEFLVDAHKRGLEQAVWRDVAERRTILRAALSDTPFTVAPVALPSRLSVEWVQVHHPFADDLQAMSFFQERELTLLPGRKFYWRSSEKRSSQQFVRISLLKPLQNFMEAVRTLRTGLEEYNSRQDCSYFEILSLEPDPNHCYFGSGSVGSFGGKK